MALAIAPLVLVHQPAGIIDPVDDGEAVVLRQLLADEFEQLVGIELLVAPQADGLAFERVEPGGERQAGAGLVGILGLGGVENDHG